MAPSLDPFPDLCLIAIFVHLPLSDLLAVIGLVCARWRVLLPTVLARRRSLKIVPTDLVVERFEPDYQYGGDELIYQVRREDGSPWAVRTKVDNRNVVVVPNVAPPHILTEPFTDGLMDSLPNITSLKVMCRDVTEILMTELFTQIIRMLNHWQDTLVTLNLSIEFRFYRAEGNIEPVVRNLLESIDQLRSLRHLKLKCNLPDVNFEPQLRIFARLFTFTYSYGFTPNWIINSMKQFANPEVITQITVKSIVGLGKLAELTPRLAAKFTMVDCSASTIVEDYEGSMENVHTLCAHFTSMQYLHIMLSVDNLHISSDIAKLQHLVHLDILLEPPYDIDRARTRKLSPINSVLFLSIKTLIGSFSSHQDLQVYQFPQLFPKVQVIKMEQCNYYCENCGFQCQFGETDLQPEWSKIHECKQLARQELTRFPNLHTIRLEQYPATSDGTISIYDFDLYDSLDQL